MELERPGAAAGSNTAPGARQVVQHCLGLEPGQQLVILADETTVEPAVAIAEAAEALHVPHTTLLVPVVVQRRIPIASDLSLLAQGVAREARAILTCVNASPECLPFRQRILETHWTARTRIGHMPGATKGVLALADVDLGQLVADCWGMEVAMARGRTLQLISYAVDGTPHRLTASIGGWERLPVASDGVIHDGAWGNVPSGETYIAPLEGSARGEVVINGSMPGLVIEPGAEIMLTFRAGHVSRITPADGPAARWLQQTQIDHALAVRDRNWANLAEIGVGLNRAVTDLTGNMLFDEKAAETAHIALGANTFMGGTISATIHCDLVIRAPTLLIDGKRVLDHGRLRLLESEWNPSFNAVSLEESPARAATKAARSGIQAGVAADGRLQRVLRPEPGRVSACFVGDPDTSQLACALYGALPDEGDWLRLGDLGQKARVDMRMLRRVLHVLWEYELVKLE